ncbi:alpha/beta hydrolase [bacterium]|nr:alpha/beta hydrolase [bacterium]MBU1995408.1 alpha/beta hydrolase [bacterium]
MVYVVFIFFTFMILAFVFYQWQYFMVFSPTYYRGEELDDDFELLKITIDDGVVLEGVVYEPKDLYRKLADINSTLLFFAGRSHDSVGLIKKLSLSFPHTRIITFNYRSYGKSGGVINEKNILEDGLQIADFVKDSYGDFYVLGFSIGSCVASYIASKRKVLSLFLVGTFDSMSSLAKEKHGIGSPWLLRYKFDNTKLVKHIDAKTYIFVSKDDEVTYINNARNLKNHVKNLTHYEELSDLTHKELLWNSAVVKKIAEALNSKA